MSKKFLSTEEVATVLRVSKRTVYRMEEDGRLHGKKHGRDWRFSKAEVLACRVRHVSKPLTSSNRVLAPAGHITIRQLLRELPDNSRYRVTKDIRNGTLPAFRHQEQGKLTPYFIKREEADVYKEKWNSLVKVPVNA